MKKIFAALIAWVMLLVCLASCGKSKGANALAETDVPTAPVSAQTTAPQTTEPKTTVPQTAAQQTTVPQTAAPKTTVPQTAAQQTTVPQTAAPQTTAPSGDAGQTVIVKLEEQISHNIDTRLSLAGYTLMSEEHSDKLSQAIADNTSVYLVVLSDGSKTYYMAVDFRTKESLSLCNPRVLREVCEKLDEKQRELADDGEFELMDYTHIVGELQLHFLGYLVTDALGGEAGPFAGLYNSFKVADLNVDESRVPPRIIRIFGLIYG